VGSPPLYSWYSPEDVTPILEYSVPRAIRLQVQNLVLFLFLVQNNLGLSGLRGTCFSRRIPRFFGLLDDGS
jgi:hypothetical protein